MHDTLYMENEGKKEWQWMGTAVLKKAGRSIHKAIRPVCIRLQGCNRYRQISMHISELTFRPAGSHLPINIQLQPKTAHQDTAS
ncbi:hypothetical protein BIV59_02825 [Bacillus sp. MUM 13]|nr:hypothetical protein BIV59_02825 [Bacillus sp. MUM 13]